MKTKYEEHMERVKNYLACREEAQHRAFIHSAKTVKDLHYKVGTLGGLAFKKETGPFPSSEIIPDFFIPQEGILEFVAWIKENF